MGYKSSIQASKHPLDTTKIGIPTGSLSIGVTSNSSNRGSQTDSPNFTDTIATTPLSVSSSLESLTSGGSISRDTPSSSDFRPLYSSTSALSTYGPLSSSTGGLQSLVSRNGPSSSDGILSELTQQTLSPLTSTGETGAVPSVQLTTLTDSSTTAIYGYTHIRDYSAVLSPTTQVISYVVTASNDQISTTVGPVFIGGGGIILFPTPKPRPPPPGGGTDINIGGIEDPIRPGPPGSKCPKLLGFLCGPSHTSDSDDGTDVDPDDKVSSSNNKNNNNNQNPQNEPNSMEEPTKASSVEQKSDSETSRSSVTTGSLTSTSPSSTRSSSIGSSSTGTATQYIIYPSDSHNTGAFESKLYHAVPSASVTISQNDRLGLLWWWASLTSEQAISLEDTSVRIFAFCE